MFHKATVRPRRSGPGILYNTSLIIIIFASMTEEHLGITFTAKMHLNTMKDRIFNDSLHDKIVKGSNGKVEYHEHHLQIVRYHFTIFESIC